VALVLGGGQTLWSDLRAALDLGEYGGVVACNDAGVYWPGPLDGWCSLHADRLAMWMEARRRRGYPPPGSAFGHADARRAYPKLVDRLTGFVEFRFPGQKSSGSSGHFALKVALVELGFDKAVLCGVPMDGNPHFFDRHGWSASDSHWAGWGESLPLIRDRVRSMSGRTRELLGIPTPDWIGASAS